MNASLEIYLFDTESKRENVILEYKIVKNA